MSVTYKSLSYEEYKNVEAQMRAFKETIHRSTPGDFYHKSIRLRLSETEIVEFHGPLVRQGELDIDSTWPFVAKPTVVVEK